ncbi:MAG: aromatic ring-hydroxylating dioxygenase subunit alpha [Gammaproteobacteria bacterium]|jgi:phenylpropionate dioxygenase-like ring-hydroxylating dioxygenase large terminal subunit|nr:aromatic ring-hydroxylating dioxygenase subunit alpha [Gammaproteobacteria bacterium]MDP6616814.1 aromatic ring-hydroxylating dioxygenase subunit alpha [Gammaproteobacteria bacterium]MDP6695245.1 aromatic ring-hydroxylating dioxygenase subunit alpha [Gammaproteobacteria bacterium]
MYINFWYPICTAEELDQENPRFIEMLGVRLVAFRDSKGGAHVLSDVCTHRGGSLAKGKVIDDCVQCPYHGWSFDGEGQCVAIPSMGDSKPPARAKVDSYPVEEKYGVVFAFLGNLPEAERPPLYEVAEVGQEGWQVSGPVVFEIDAYFERSVENGLDPLHNEFVHPAQGAPKIESDQFEVEDAEWGSRFIVNFGGYTQAEKRQKVAQTSDTETEGLNAGSWHHGPNTLLTEIHLTGNNDFIQYFYEAPLSPSRTRIFFISARNNTLGAENDDWIHETYLKIAAEDIAILENLWPVRTPDTLTKELMMPGDAPVIRYREYLKDWEKRGWRIDLKALKRGKGDTAWAIPCPARRESGNWVLDPIPLVE